MSFYILPLSSINGTSVWESGNSINSIVQNRTSNKPVANSSDTLVFGENSYANADYSIVIGSGSTSTTKNSIIIGNNNSLRAFGDYNSIIGGSNNYVDDTCWNISLLGVNNFHASGFTNNIIIIPKLQFSESQASVNDEVDPMLVVGYNGEVFTRDSSVLADYTTREAFKQSSRIFLPISGGTGGPYFFTGDTLYVSSSTTFVALGTVLLGNANSTIQVHGQTQFNSNTIVLNNSIPPAAILYKDLHSPRRMTGSTALTFTEQTGLVTLISLSATSQIFCGNTTLQQAITNVINDQGSFGIQQRLDAINIDFAWAKGEGTSTGSTGTYYTAITMTSFTISSVVETIRHNLITNFSDYSFISQFNPILLIDRYKSKRRKGTNNSGEIEYAKSGFKHPDVALSGITEIRPSEIPITNQKMILDFGQEHYFRIHAFPIPKGLRGKKKQYRYNINTITGKGWNYLSFRIRITKDGTTYESNPLNMLKLIGISSSVSNYISYQYV